MTLSQDFSNFLDVIYESQNDDLPVIVEYGTSTEAINGMNIVIEIPIPPFKLKLQYDQNKYVSYENTSYGKFVKGKPYLQNEVSSLTDPGFAFDEVVADIWSGVSATSVYSDLLEILINNSFTGRLFDRGTVITMNDNGSKLYLNDNSIPEGLDATYTHWEWADEPVTENVSDENYNAIKDYNNRFRKQRQRIAELEYGIGGFYKFDPEQNTFQDTTIISIVYTDDELGGLDENTLAVYFEDELGSWHHLPSTVNADSNFVKARIYEFTTYTLAPTLPQGEFWNVCNS